MRFRMYLKKGSIYIVSHGTMIEPLLICTPDFVPYLVRSADQDYSLLSPFFTIASIPYCTNGLCGIMGGGM